MAITLTLIIEDADAARLATQAAEVGLAPATWAERLLSRAIREPTLDETLAPIRERFKDLTDQEVEELASRLVDEVREESARDKAKQ